MAVLESEDDYATSLYVATCRVEGCGNFEIEITVPSHPSRPSAQCGPCGGDISDLKPTE